VGSWEWGGVTRSDFPGVENISVQEEGGGLKSIPNINRINGRGKKTKENGGKKEEIRRQGGQKRLIP